MGAANGEGGPLWALALGGEAEGRRIAVEQPGGTLFVESGERFCLEGEVLLSCRGTVELAAEIEQVRVRY